MEQPHQRFRISSTADLIRHGFSAQQKAEDKSETKRMNEEKEERQQSEDKNATKRIEDEKKEQSKTGKQKPA